MRVSGRLTAYPRRIMNVPLSFGAVKKPDYLQSAWAEKVLDPHYESRQPPSIDSEVRTNNHCVGFP